MTSQRIEDSRQERREVLAAHYLLGVDLGQAHDPTAIALVERAEMQGDWDGAAYAYRKEVELRLRYLRRMPLGTPYPEIVEELRRLTWSRRLAGRCQMAVDGTGVGRAVVDMLRAENLGCPMLPVMVTGGQTESARDGYCYVPKRDLIVGLQVTMQRGGLKISRGLADGPRLVRELGEMRVRVTAAGNEQYGTWREREHDDLVFAVAVACWAERKRFLRRAEHWLSREPGRWKW